MKLKHESEKMRAVIGLRVFIEGGDIPAARAHDTRRRRIDSADDIEQCTFAAAAFTGDNGFTARFDRKIERF